LSTKKKRGFLYKKTSPLLSYFGSKTLLRKARMIIKRSMSKHLKISIIELMLFKRNLNFFLHKFYPAILYFFRQNFFISFKTNSIFFNPKFFLYYYFNSLKFLDFINNKKVNLKKKTKINYKLCYYYFRKKFLKVRRFLSIRKRLQRTRFSYLKIK